MKIEIFAKGCKSSGNFIVDFDEKILIAAVRYGRVFDDRRSSDI